MLPNGVVEKKRKIRDSGLMFLNEFVEKYDTSVDAPKRNHIKRKKNTRLQVDAPEWNHRKGKKNTRTRKKNDNKFNCYANANILDFPNAMQFSCPKKCK